jgi:geranylgeranyl pyrophosphate synthase
VGSVLGSALSAFGGIADLAPGELAHFGARLWQFLTSCEERRLAEYEQIPWWGFIDAESHSRSYQRFLAAGITRSLVAAHAETASTRTIGSIFTQLLLDLVDPSVATSDRVLDGPTNEVWLYPWLQYLRGLGVTYLRETDVIGIDYADGRVRGVRVASADGAQTLTADHYVCALPVERVVPLLTPELVGADPRLDGLRELAGRCLEWMNGVQFYLRRPARMVRGHMIHIDTEWALTSISQIDVWRPGIMDRYGPDTIRGIVSVDVSDWDAPAPNGRSATDSTREEVCVEVWRQLKRSVNVAGGDQVLADEDLIGYFIDSSIDRDPAAPGRLANAEPLLVNLVDSWRLRPDAATAIPNLVLASDYVRTHTDLATMEGANEAARRAVNVILDREGHVGERCRIWPLEEPEALAPLRQYDALRFGLGLGWDANLTAVAAAGVGAADPLLQPVAQTISSVAPPAPQVQQLADRFDQDLPDQAGDGVARSIGGGAQELRGVAGPPPDGPSPPAGRDSGPVGFADRLEWYRGLTMAALAAAVPAAEPQQYLYGPIREFLDRPSKGLRPALCLASCLAHGGRIEDALPSAAGIEMLHNAFLVHDDIEDGSESRRGRPALHRQFGVPLAVNMGDAMNALSMGLFRQNVALLGADPAMRIFDEVDHMLRESLEGQALELGWIEDNRCDLDTDDYLRLVLKKTAWYSFIHPLRIGAVAAGADPAALDRFHAFGFLLGAAFQIHDDLLNLVGDAAHYGKEIAGDLWEGKRTLPLIYALSGAGPAERSMLVDFAGRGRDRRLTRQVADVHRILRDGGSIERTVQVRRALAAAAEQRLPEAFAGAHDGPDLAFVRALVDYVVQRAV